jgi:predicted unusual protein kinase regulating ubiquinone biosynthesis (AarF/ABC1/UbiB family)
MGEFRVIMEKQVDLRYEARNLTRLRHNFARSRTITFPQPLYSTERVLIETYEEGIPIGQFVATRAQSTDEREMRSVLARLGLRAVCKMVFVDNFVHGDMHPGNILVQNHERPIQLNSYDMFYSWIERYRRSVSVWVLTFMEEYVVSARIYFFSESSSRDCSSRSGQE